MREYLELFLSAYLVYAAGYTLFMHVTYLVKWLLARSQS